MLMYGRPVLVSLEVTLHAKAWQFGWNAAE
jgi:hypothetical protein